MFFADLGTAFYDALRARDALDLMYVLLDIVLFVVAVWIISWRAPLFLKVPIYIGYIFAVAVYPDHVHPALKSVYKVTYYLPASLLFWPIVLYPLMFWYWDARPEKRVAIYTGLWVITLIVALASIH